MPNIYKKKNPRAPYIKQIILYSIMLVFAIVTEMWLAVVIFLVLIGFAGFMLYKKWDKESHSLADYIHSYDSDFPTESQKQRERREARSIEELRQQEYANFLAQVEEDFEDFDDEDDEEYGDE